MPPLTRAAAERLIEAFAARRRAGLPLDQAARGALRAVLASPDLQEAATTAALALLAPRGAKARARAARPPQPPPRPDPELERIARLKRELK